MKPFNLKSVRLALVVSTLTAPLPAQWLNQPTPGIPRTADGKPNLAAPAPRTRDGKPDLSGLWFKISQKYGANIAADLKPGEVQPWAEALVQQRREDLGKNSTNVQCLPLGPASVTADHTSVATFKIVQAPDVIVFLYANLTYRQIFMDGRALETDPNPSWMGYSVGHWENDTLVVESNGFNDRSWLDAFGHPHTEALRTTERYRRPDFGHLELEMTLADPTIYARPWTVALRAELDADNGIIEYVCNEANKGQEHWVGTAADDRKSAVKVAPEILAKYVGTYKEVGKLWAIAPRTVEITLSGEAIFGNLDGRGSVQLSATTETAFAGFNGLGLEFLKDSQDGHTNLIVKHVSGDYRFERAR